MKKKTLKRVLAASLAAAMVMPLSACGTKEQEKKEGENTADVTIDQIKLGEDYTDLEANLKFLTHKTDVEAT